VKKSSARFHDFQLIGGEVLACPLNGTTYDYSGLNNYGTFSGSLTTTRFVNSEYGTTILFGGANNNYIWYPDAPWLRLSGSLSISVWVKILSALPAFETDILGKENVGLARPFSYTIQTNGNLRLYKGYASSSAGNTSTTPVPLYTWQHLGFTIGGPILTSQIGKHYLNGQLTRSATLNLSSGASDTGEILTVGAGIGAGNNLQNVLIRNLRLFNREINGTEILYLYESGQ